MLKPEHKTRILRATVAQEARIILGPAEFWRRVQVVMPPEPAIFLGVDVEPGIVTTAGIEKLPENASPDGLTLDQAGQTIGWDRSYKLPEMNGQPYAKFNLAPGQWLTSAAINGMATLALIVEWIPDPTLGVV